MHWQFCNFTFNDHRKVDQLVLVVLDIKQNDPKEMGAANTLPHDS